MVAALLGAIGCGSVLAQKEASSQQLGLIPMPAQVEVLDGSFALGGKATIAASSKDEKNVGSFIASFLKGKGVKAKEISKIEFSDKK